MTLAQTARLLDRALDAENVRPQPMVRETFEVFVIHDQAIAGVGTTISRGSYATLDEALTIGLPSHKTKFFVRCADTLSGAVMLRFYAVKRKSRPAYCYHDYQTRAVHDLYAEHLFDLRGDAVRAEG